MTLGIQGVKRNLFTVDVFPVEITQLKIIKGTHVENGIYGIP